LIFNDFVDANGLVWNRMGYMASVEDSSSAFAAEQARRRSEERLSQVIELIPEMVMLTRSIDGRIIDLNAAWEAITGWPRALSIGRTTTELGLWKDNKEREAILALLDKDGKLIAYRGELHRRDGSVGRMELSMWRIEQERDALLLSVMRDTTETERIAEKAVQATAACARSEAMLAGAFEANPNSACIIRTGDGKIIQANEAFERLTGMTRNELIGHSAIELGILPTQNDHENVQAHLASEPVVREFPANIRDRLGALHKVRISAAQFDLDTDACRVVIVRDVTEQLATEATLQEVEANFRTFFAMAPIPLVVTTSDGEFITVNQAWSRTYGWSEEEVVGRHSLDFPNAYHLDPVDRARLYAILHSQGRVDGFDVRARRKDSSPVFALMQGVPGKVNGRDVILWSVEDVTRLRDAQLQIVKLNANLQAQVEERDRALDMAVKDLGLAREQLLRNAQISTLGALLAALTQELAPPITNSMIAAETQESNAHELTRSLTDGKLSRAMLERYAIDASATAELSLRNLKQTSELLSCVKQIAADQLSEKRRSFELRDLVKGLQLTLPRNGRHIDNKIEAGLEMNSYPGPLGLVLMNLVKTSLQHSLDQIKDGRISIEAHPNHDGWVTLAVSDNGKGIAPEHLKHLLNPFFTISEDDDTTKRDLDIVQSLVATPLGGKITASNLQQGGACFTLQLPVSPPSLPRDSDCATDKL